MNWQTDGHQEYNSSLFYERTIVLALDQGLPTSDLRQESPKESLQKLFKACFSSFIAFP